MFDTPGRSLYLRLSGERAGKWTAAATGEHGDLLAEVCDSLTLPLPCPRAESAPSGSPAAARRLFHRACPVPGTLAETYLRAPGHHCASGLLLPAVPSRHLLSRSFRRAASILAGSAGRRHRFSRTRSRQEQDGSEVRSVELERLIERRNAFEFCRDHAAERFETLTGSTWRPRSGSMVNHRTLTAAIIDSRDFLAARSRVDAQVLIPAGARIAFTGGLE